MAEAGTTLRPGPAPASEGIEKAAILLLTLGPEVAGQVFSHLSDAEVEQISIAIARLRTIRRAQAAAVHEEAWRWLTSREGYLVDGEQFAHRLLTARAAATGQAPRTVRDLARPRDGETSLAESRRGVAPAALANLEVRQAAETRGLLPPDTQADVVRRIADLKTIPSEVLVEVASVLRGQVEELGSVGQGGRSVGGPKLAATIMNQVGKEVEAAVLARLDEEAPEVAESIRKLMLTFDDLAVLERRDMQTLLKEIQREDLLLALKTASPAMREKIFGNIPKQAAEILEEDLSMMGPVRLKDVEQAQANIVATARRLAEEQKITLGTGGEDLV